jgi:hypothetical protein
MQITEIVVNAGRTFNHPYESYSNLRPSVTLKATIAEGEDPDATTKQLQAKAESLVEDHKRNMLQSLEELHHLEQAQAEMINLEKHFTDTQERIKELREKHPRLQIQVKPE